MIVRALILAPFSEDHLSRLRRRLEVDYESWLETRRLTDPEELSARLNRQDIAILVVESDFVFEEVFEEAPHLKFVGVCRNATNHVDVDAATSHGVVVVNTPARNAEAVAEHALGLMLALARRTAAAHRYVTEGRWKNPADPYISMRGIELAGRTLGIIGLGTIGRRLAEMGAALGMNVVAHDPYLDSATEAKLTTLDDLMVCSDFISVHAPATAETEGLLDERALRLAKRTAYLVSTSDASVIDQRALVSILTEKRIAGAALDVFETHPIAPDSPLLSLDNVVLTPHLGGATEETVQRHSRMMADDILRFLDGQRPNHLVNPEVWDRGR